MLFRSEGRRGSEEAVPGPSVLPSGEPGVSGDFWVEQLCKVINQETKFVQERVPFPLREQIPEFVPRDQVWSRTGNTTPWPHIGRVRILLL